MNIELAMYFKSAAKLFLNSLGVFVEISTNGSGMSRGNMGKKCPVVGTFVVLLKKNIMLWTDKQQ